MRDCLTHEDCIDRAVLRAEEICRDKGLRFTRLRRRVFELVWASHAPIKAYAILDRLDVGAAKPPTVYRALGFLLEHGLAHRLDSLNAYVGCGHPLRHDDCYFLCCSGCGKIQECCSDELHRAIGKAAGKNRFKPTRTTLEITGECRECRLGKA